MFKVKTKLTNDTVNVYLACDPHIKGANSEENLVKYIKSGDSSLLEIPEGASFVVMKPLTPADMDKVRDRMPSQSFLGAHISSKKERDLDIKEALSVFQSIVSREESTEKERVEALDALSRAEADFLEALSEQERKALQSHSQWITAFGLEMAIESIVSFPFTDENDEPYTPKDRAEVKKLLKGIHPKSLSDEIIGELVAHSYRLSYLSNEGKA